MSLVQTLYASINARWMPEQVVKAIFDGGGDGDMMPKERDLLRAALPRYSYSSMSSEFAKADRLDKQLKVAEELFNLVAPSPSNPGAVRNYLDDCMHILQATGGTDFKANRLTRSDRKKLARAGAPVPKGHRAYNKRFRLLHRMEVKYGRWLAVGNMRDLAMLAKSRLATRISRDDFCGDMTTARFIAYLTAKLNKRSIFTSGKQERPYDEIADLLFQKLDKSTANWFAVAHVYPQPWVLAHLTDEQKGRLLGTWYSVMVRAAKVLKVQAEKDKPDLVKLIVQRGNDSSTWNEAAGAFNKAREGWMNTLYALDGNAMLDRFAPGKALRLMAADVAYMHRAAGDGLEPDTAVWNELPKPWETVLDGVTCNRAMIEAACARFKIEGKGWIAPRPSTVADWKPTPELVYGVVVESPELASALKKAGYYAGPAKWERKPPAGFGHSTSFYEENDIPDGVFER